MSKQQSEGAEAMSDYQSGRDQTAEQIDGFRNDGKRAATEELVEGTIESAFAAERYSVDSTFEVLSHPGQRYVLTYLLQSDGAVSLSDLIEYAAEQSDGTVDSNFRHKITIELTHTVLPKLSDHGFIEYDIEQQLVEPTERTPVVEPYLRLALAQQELATERSER